MQDQNEKLSLKIPYNVLKIDHSQAAEVTVEVACEVPLTLTVNTIEIATLACSPQDIKELVIGFLYTSGFISSYNEVGKIVCNDIRWQVNIEVKNTPDLNIMNKRLYTSGCGKGVMFTNIVEMNGRKPLLNGLICMAADLMSLAHWLQVSASQAHRQTRGVHTAAISQGGKQPAIAFDDIGRHNAVDKALGWMLMHQQNFSDAILLCTGRISSEILHKARRCEIPVIVSLGAPTHQSVLLAHSMNMTLVGFAGRQSLIVYSHPERIFSDTSK